MMLCGMSSRPARSFRWPREAEDVRLVDVLEEREAAGHVAVERRVADGELALVPRREREPAELVRERHHEKAADAGLDVLLGHPGSVPSKARASACLTDSTIGSIGISM